jgi:hypothetical protein
MGLTTIVFVTVLLAIGALGSMQALQKAAAGHQAEEQARQAYTQAKSLIAKTMSHGKETNKQLASSLHVSKARFGAQALSSTCQTVWGNIVDGCSAFFGAEHVNLIELCNSACYTVIAGVSETCRLEFIAAGNDTADAAKHFKDVTSFCTNARPCFSTIGVLFDGTCDATFDELKSDSPSFTSICTSRCFTTLSGITPQCTLAATMGDSKDGAGLATAIGLLNVVCATKGPSGSRCGTVFHTLGAATDCGSIHSEGSCNGDCHWTNDHCDRVLTPTYLDSFCSPCFALLVQQLYIVAGITNQTDAELNGFDARTLSEINDYLCVKIDGQYCPIVLAPIIGDSAIPDGEKLTNLCGNNTQKACYNTLLPYVVRKQHQQALDQAHNCAQQFNNLQGTARNDSIRSVCLPCYAKSQSTNHKIALVNDNVCVKNSNQSYCVQIVKDLEHGLGSDEANACSQQIDGDAPTCSPSCNTIFSNIVTNRFGCCLGFISDFVNRTELSASEKREFWEVVAPPTTPPGPQGGRRADQVLEVPVDETPSASGSSNSASAPNSGPIGEGSQPASSFGGSGGECSQDGGFDFGALAICSSLTTIVAQINNQDARCHVTFSSRKIHIQFHLRVDCGEINRHAGFKAKFEEAIRGDIAHNCHVSKANILGTALTCSSSSSRRMELLAESDATVDFDIQTEDDTVTSNAAALFNQQLAAGTLTFPDTTSVVQSDCPSCVSLTSLGTIGQTPAPTSSASTTLFMTLAVVLALLQATL